ncbi:Coiled-coil domain-containing protein 47 [Madurella mycetomatis]|uniref:Coiled-coil domain-containing protein 47 n=1 Tax=Madurella mycetomatis TaxID=100816 RepID=A0A175W7P7_9PEZI|nr:Coiled-coil domain-containing protein 47 [Madurella mycetomatis]
MANVLNNLFGASKSESPDPVQGDSDFADFSQSADPSPIPFSPKSNTLAGAQPEQTVRPYTKWYRVHERHSLSEFKAEGIILSIIAVALIFHLVGARLNRSKAKKWIRAHAAPLASEFAIVGFAGVPAAVADQKGDELVQALADSNARQGDSLLKEKSLFEFATYATGRANVAFLDVKLTLLKRFNPLTAFFESAFGFLFESFPQPQDVVEATLYPFDGKEALTVPGLPGAAELRNKDSKSAFDGFVWAIVHKERMKQVRDDRYDVSLTFTKDHAKLPSWLTAMSENAEITDALLTPELVKAAEAAGDLFEYLIVSDQPIDKPKTIDETAPRKRVFLKYRIPSNNDYTSLLPIFKYFLRITDHLTQVAHFRQAVIRKVKGTREEIVKQLQRADETSKAEERALERERAKKAKRDQELNALDAKGQKKYLEKEKEKEMRKNVKKQTSRA